MKYPLFFFILLNIYYSTSLNAQHIIPESIKEEALIALSHYPELKDTPIEFKFKKSIKKSTMQAQPEFASIFKGKKKRKYKILIAEQITISDTLCYTRDMPSEIVIGWLGHELGHIMDFKHRSGTGLIGFGIGYISSKKYIRKAERRADSFAVTHGMEKYILATKEFILERAGLSKKYVDRIKRLYLSPEEIMQLVKDRDMTDALDSK